MAWTVPGETFFVHVWESFLLGIMSNFSAGKQVVRPPQRGIFPLDHDAECRESMKTYLNCLSESNNDHYRCRDLSKAYLQCRMDHKLMAEEDLDKVMAEIHLRCTLHSSINVGLIFLSFKAWIL